MASLSKDGSGWRILFVSPSTRKRHTLRLGKCAAKNAQVAQNMVERLVEARRLGNAPDGQAAEWLKGIDDTLRDRLVKVGLVERVKASTLSGFLDAFIDQHRQRGDVTESTLTVWGHTRRNLVAYFGPNIDPRTIRAEDADAWAAWLKTSENLAENTLRKRCQFAKRFFSVAEARGLVDRNPFKGLVATTIPVPERQVFIDRATVDALLAECATLEQRLLLLFARYMGVRVPSEIVPLRWVDVNWAAMQVTITSPKTKRHKGGDKRLVPIFPEILPFLQEAWEAAPEGAVWVFPSVRSGAKNLRTWLERAILKTGRKPWPRLWVNFRASRATELADQYPSHVAAAWLGHTETIADAHYRQVTAEHFSRATTEATGALPTWTDGPKTLAHFPAHSPHISLVSGFSKNAKSPENPGIDGAWGTVNTPQVEDNGLEPMTFWLPARRSPN